MVVSCWTWCWELNLDPVGEQDVSLAVSYCPAHMVFMTMLYLLWLTVSLCVLTVGYTYCLYTKELGEML